MTDQDVVDPHDALLDPVVRRRRIAITAVRSIVQVAALLAAYALLPIDEADSSRIALRVIAAVVIVIGAVSYQVVAVARSATPALRGVEAFAFAVPLLLVAAASSYLALSSNDPAAFDEPLDHVGALYFAMTTLTTIGYGDIAPTSDGARIVVMVQMVVNVAVIGVALRLITTTVRTSLARRRRQIADTV